MYFSGFCVRGKGRIRLGVHQVRQTARAMAEGACRLSGADASIAVTGIAGPEGGTPEKPVGLVYIGCMVKGRTKVEKFRFTGNRQKNREYAVARALILLRECLLAADR